MKIGQALKVIDSGWIHKDKGYRVHYQRQTEKEVTTEYTPDLDDAPLDSDVAAWRTAWKLQQATQENNSEFGEGKMILPPRVSRSHSGPRPRDGSRRGRARPACSPPRARRHPLLRGCRHPWLRGGRSQPPRQAARSPCR